MRLTSTAFFVVIIKLCFSNDAPIVTTTLGKVKGHYRTTAKNIKYEAYEGVPYAVPPLRDSRFMPPIPVEAWQGVIHADTPRQNCWGYLLGEFQEGSEDCLYLNIYVPEEKSTNQSLPVILYIHGGGFQFSTLKGAEQNNFMDQNVIFVTARYRVGALGFLSTEDEIVSGNMGLKDQVTALKWVKEHIESFGGDSSRITIVGESAGGASVHYHYLSPMSRGLFSSGISISGTALMPWTQAKNSREKAFKLAELMNCNNTDIREMIRCLKYKPALSILEAQRKFTAWRETDFSPFGPVVEKSIKDAFINRSPIDIINSGDAQKLPWITSLVSEEGLYPLATFITNNTILRELDENWELIAPQLLQYHHTVPKSEQAKIARKIKEYYLGDEPINNNNLLNLTHLIGDRIFSADSIKAAKLQAKANHSPVWYYYFTYKPSLSLTELLTHTKKNFGTSHADDILLTYEELYGLKKEKNDVKMQKKLITMWVSVAYKGIPDLDFNWKNLSYHGDDDFEYLEISGPENLKMVSNNGLSNYQFWDSINFHENPLS